MEKPFIIVVAGPTGVGKTTVSKQLSDYFKCVYLSEDEITKEIYPEIYVDIEAYPDKLNMIDDRLLRKAEEMYISGRSVVIDRINLDYACIDELRKRFGEHLLIRVLWPFMEVAIERDKGRKDWTSGEIAIKRFYDKYEGLKSIVGAENFLDNSRQKPEETLAAFITSIELT